MQAVALRALLREQIRRGETRKIRQRGDIPAVVYGKQVPPRWITLDGVQFRRAHVGNHGLVRLQIQGDGEVHAMIQEVQRDPITQAVLHVDFHAVSLSEPVESTVSVILNGLEKVEKRGGMIQQQVREIRVRCLPTDVPEYILLDISHLEIGGRIDCSQIDLPPNVELRSDPDEVVVNVVSPRAGETGQVPENPTPGVLKDRDNKGVASDGMETPVKA
jgi:large subunit ribosomal protein L25